MCHKIVNNFANITDWEIIGQLKAWTTEKALDDAKRDLECEHFRAGIGFGDWAKPWERMSDKEKNGAIIGRVKENIEKEAQSQYGLLEMQSRWAAWREAMIAMDLSWNNMFQFGDSLIRFALRVVYGTVITPSLKSKWDGDEDGNCKLCLVKPGTIQHILSGCIIIMNARNLPYQRDVVGHQRGSRYTYSTAAGQ